MPAPRIILLLTAMTLGAFSGCDTSRNEIVGKWKATSGSGDVVWEFFDNGTLDTAGSPGRYSFGDGKRIKVQTRTATFVYQFEVKGDRMTWIEPSGSRMEFTRVK